MDAATKSEFPGGLGIGQSWRQRDRTYACRIVTIDPAMHIIEIEDPRGDVERDTIEHFLETYLEEAG